MKKIIFAFLLLPLASIGQNGYESLDSASKAKVDSIVHRMGVIKQSKPHHKMVSFSEWSIDGMNDFFSYLLYDLNYKSAATGSNINLVKTKDGYAAKFYKMSNGYNSVKQNLTIYFYCAPNSDMVKRATIVAPLSMLVDIYLKYFGGAVREDTPGKGGLDKTYTITDEVRLFPDKITIKPHNNIFSTD